MRGAVVEVYKSNQATYGCLQTLNHSRRRTNQDKPAPIVFVSVMLASVRLRHFASTVYRDQCFLAPPPLGFRRGEPPASGAPSRLGPALHQRGAVAAAGVRAARAPGGLAMGKLAEDQGRFFLQWMFASKRRTWELNRMVVLRPIQWLPVVGPPEVPDKSAFQGARLF